MSNRSFRLPGRSRAVLLGGLASLAVTVPFPLTGQIVGSERGTLTQIISGTQIEIDYARPSVRGRQNLFGGQIPWGEVWTPGANEATTFRFSKDVTLNGREVPAGKYSIWMQVLEDEPWVLLLHSDTTLYHTQHPTLDEGLLTMPVEPQTLSDFVETLTWDVDAVRADHAVLQLRWGLMRVDVDLGVDPGYILTVEPGEAAPYEGAWTMDRSMGIPPDSVVAEWSKEMSEDVLHEMETWLDSMREPSHIRLVYDAEEHRLYGYDPATAASWGEEGTDKPQFLLVPKAEGIFNAGLLINGELAFLGDMGFWEFEFGPDGRAITLTERLPDDTVQGRATRTGG